MKDNFIPKKSEKEVISIRIGTEFLGDIDKIASESAISRNELIVQCINYAIDNLSSKN